MRRPAIPQRMLAFTLALCMATPMGGHERQFHIVAVQGTRVHLRSHLPLQLDHSGVKRHLRPGETFYVERVGYGLSWTGHGTAETWYYVRSLHDPNDHGWVHAQFLVQLRGHHSADWIEIVPSPVRIGSPAMTLPATPAAHSPATEPPAPRAVRPIVSGAPQPPSRTWSIALLDNLLSIANSLVQLIATFASIFGISWLMGMRPARHAPAPVIAQPPVTSQPAASAKARRNANFVYGRCWKIAATRPIREEKR